MTLQGIQTNKGRRFRCCGRKSNKHLAVYGAVYVIPEAAPSTIGAPTSGVVNGYSISVIYQFHQYRFARLYSSLGIRTHGNGATSQRASVSLSREAARPDRASVSRVRLCQSMSNIQAF
eukprot:6179831-Pleurochrysis_carterae.AAC.1